jgi:hypothetical protein
VTDIHGLAAVTTHSPSEARGKAILGVI